MQYYCSVYNNLIHAHNTYMHSGPPLPPQIRSSSPSALELLLEWDRPFTWPGHEILGYNISELGLDSVTRIFNTTNQTHSYFSPSGKLQKSCQNITFIVAAVSDLGLGKPDMLISGLPIGTIIGSYTLMSS